MANSVSALNKQKYIKTLQALLEESLIAMDLATMRYTEGGDGNTINYPRPVYNNIEQYTKYTAVNDSDIEYTNETLTIDQTPIISFVYDEIDNIENGYDVISQQVGSNAFRLRQYIEGKFFNEYVNAGTTNTTVTLSATNVVNTYSQSTASLRNDGVDDKKLCIVVDPFTMGIIGEGALGNTFQVADESYKRGYKGQFQGAMLYETSNLTATGDLALATNPIANDTVTVNGVVFKFVATIGTAGDVLIGATAADSVDNLVAAINGATAPTLYTEVSKTNRAKLQSITATDNTTSITLTSSRGYRPVSSSLTDPADKWGAITINTLVMEKGAISMALQREPNLVVRDLQDQLGKRYMSWTKFGIKTFSEGAERMLVQPLVAQAAEA